MDYAHTPSSFICPKIANFPGLLLVSVYMPCEKIDTLKLFLSVKLLWTGTDALAETQKNVCVVFCFEPLDLKSNYFH